MATSRSLSTPRAGRASRPKLFAPDAFGTWSEQFARYLGTSTFILQMSVFIVAWLLWNTVTPAHLRFDPYQFQFLTLLLSLQASYAAPLILLAQNRQDDRDRVDSRADRERAAMGVAINSYVTRELAEMRSKINDLTLDVANLSRSLREPDAGRPEVGDPVPTRLGRIELSLTQLTDLVGTAVAAR